MEYSELTPEEKLYDAIFGRTGWPDGVHHWLSPEGSEALHSVIKRAAEKYGDRGVRVLRLRFGFEPRTAKENAKRPCPYPDSRTLEEVGPYFNVTRERIRQMEAKALRILRHPACSRELKPFLRREDIKQ